MITPSSQLDLTLLLGLKIGFILLLALYSVFAVLIVRQVAVMTKTLEVGFESPIRFITAIHLVMSLAALFFAIFIL